jgi:hypothetical protein
MRYQIAIGRPIAHPSDGLCYLITTSFQCVGLLRHPSIVTFLDQPPRNRTQTVRRVTAGCALRTVRRDCSGAYEEGMVDMT